MAQTTATQRHTVTFHFRRATDLPVADIPSFSSDPYFRARLDFPDTPYSSLVYRGPTARRELNPEWNVHWSVANIPATGAVLKITVLDEDSPDRDDRLGVVHIPVQPAGEDNDNRYRLKVSKGGNWIALSRIVTVGCGQGKWKRLGGIVDVGIEINGITDLTELAGEVKECLEVEKPFTAGPNWWSTHASPLIGRITSTSAADAESGVKHFTFVANKLQLSGPLPPQLEHDYVAFAPWVQAYFTSKGIRGLILNRLLKKQYRTVYSYNKNTAYGVVSPDKITDRFLEMTHWGEGGRLFTYVLTLDAEWHFTETGPEFGIQMLSKHTMHSNVTKRIAWAGEFLVRQIHGKHHHHDALGKLSHQEEQHSGEDPNQAHNTTEKHQEKEPKIKKPHMPFTRAKDKEGEVIQATSPPLANGTTTSYHPTPKDFELVIDNDSGTYRPPKDQLHLLQAFLSRNLRGLKVTVFDCFDEQLTKIKEEHAKEKEAMGKRRFRQQSVSSSDGDASSISSSDEEDLEEGKVPMKERAVNFLMHEGEGGGSGSAPPPVREKNPGVAGKEGE